MIIFRRRYGFITRDGEKYIGYLYEDTKTKRRFSAANKLGLNILYLNEIDEGFTPQDNTYSTITARSLSEAKRKIEDMMLPQCQHIKHMA